MRVRVLAGVCSLVFLALGAGCASQEELDNNRVDNTPPYRPTNVFSAPTLPDDIRRVVLLPAVAYNQREETRVMVINQAATLLTRTNRVETVPIMPRELANMYGRDTISATEVLPNDFFEQLERRYAADAVLFTELTRYSAYPPVMVGVRMNLVSLKDGKSLWAFDDVFDAGDARVASGALKYEQMNARVSYPMNNARTVLQSPSLFTAYAFYTAFSTLPPRGSTLETVHVTRKDAQNPNEQANPTDRTKSDHPDIPVYNK